MIDLPQALSAPVDRDSDLPVGVQLARRLRAAVGDGTLAAGQRAPSIRALADAARVNPNTVRAVYQRLEDEGVLRSEQGRGTFVLPSSARDRGTRRQLQAEVARLEAELVRRPPPSGAVAPPGAPQGRSAPSGRLLTTDELARVRDELLARLDQLDADRAEIVRRLDEIAVESPAKSEPAPRRSNYSVANARVRWLGGGS